jgi:hypothetical protein
MAAILTYLTGLILGDGVIFKGIIKMLGSVA